MTTLNKVTLTKAEKEQLRNIIGALNLEYGRFIELLVSHSDILTTPRNLKLYDIAYNRELEEKYNLSDEEYNNFFNDFCEDNYEFFMEWLDEEEIDKSIMKYVGNTSTFYIAPESVEVTYNNRLGYKEIDIEYTLENTVGYPDYVVTDNGVIDYEKTVDHIEDIQNYYSFELAYMEDLQDWVNWLKLNSTKIYNELKEELNSAKKLAEYLEDFKNKQVEYFDDFIDGQIEFEKELLEIGRIEKLNKYTYGLL